MDKIFFRVAFRRIAAHPKLKSKLQLIPRRNIWAASALLSTLWLLAGLAFASNHYTEKQLDALAARVGKVFWVKSVGGKLPSFRTAPAAGAPTFVADEKGSFEIIELTGRASRTPYYKVKFSSGKEGYIGPESFHEELNLTILTVDPYVNERRKIEEAAKDEQARVEWIQAQPWSPAIKQAAIQKQPVPGLTTGEIRKVLGVPSRVLKLPGPSNINEERWYYPDGKVLTFHNELLTAIDQQERK